MNFKDFKKNQVALKESVTKMAQKPDSGYEDARFWSLTKDAAGNANATIRFLPQQDPSKAPIKLTFYHRFKTEGRWFSEECPFTIGEKCPVCEFSSTINWDGSKAEYEEGSKHWRTKGYYANILVVKDEANPENEGKVFLYKFGHSIYKLIEKIIAPKDEDETPLNIFDFDSGYNFKLKMIQKSGFNNYDENSKFVMTASEIADGDEKAQEEIYNSILPFDECYDKKLYKSYEEIQKKFNSLQGATEVPNIQEEMDKIKKEQKVVDKTIAKKQTEPDLDEDPDDDEMEIDFDSLLSDD